MNAVALDRERATTVLCGLSSIFDPFTAAIDFVTNDKKLIFAFIWSRLMQEKQRVLERYNSANKNFDLALVGKSDGRISLRHVFACFTANEGIIQNTSARESIRNWDLRKILLSLKFLFSPTR